MELLRVLIADDHPMFRHGMVALLEAAPEFTVVGEATDRSEALAIAAAEQPDIVLLDLDLDGSSGLDLLPELQDVAGKARVILLTGVPANLRPSCLPVRQMTEPTAVPGQRWSAPSRRPRRSRLRRIPTPSASQARRSSIQPM